MPNERGRTVHSKSEVSKVSVVDNSVTLDHSADVEATPAVEQCYDLVTDSKLVVSDASKAIIELLNGRRETKFKG
ncbi:hypothetical protein ACOSQ3_023184 [Xanthoceras sorbifolium]